MVRSATQVDAELIARADSLRVIGRAGVGVDNVDVSAATRRGILVCNAPQSNIVSAAEHTIALLLAIARNVPQAHAALVEDAGSALASAASSSTARRSACSASAASASSSPRAHAGSACGSWPTTRT